MIHVLNATIHEYLRKCKIEVSIRRLGRSPVASGRVDAEPQAEQVTTALGRVAEHLLVVLVEHIEHPPGDFDTVPQAVGEGDVTGCVARSLGTFRGDRVDIVPGTYIEEGEIAAQMLREIALDGP